MRPAFAAVLPAELEIGLLLPEAARPVDDAFPPAAAGKGEPDGGRSLIDVPVVIIFLAVGFAQAGEVEAALVQQVGVGGGVRVCLRPLEALRPVLEQFGQGLLYGLLEPALILPPAADDLRFLGGGEQFVLAAIRALALLQPRAVHPLETELRLERFDDL